MKNEKRLAWIVASLATFLMLTGFAPKGHRGGDPAKMQQALTRKLDRILDELDATPDQRAEIESIRDDFLAKHPQPPRRGGKGELLSMMKSDEVDAAKLHERIDETLAARSAFLHDAADALVRVHRVLTPEQREQVVQMWEKRAEKKQKRMHRMKKRHAPAQE